MYGFGNHEEREFKTIEFENGDYYEGEVKIGTEIPDGRGFIFSESVFEGYFKNGKPHRKCITIEQNGDYVVVDF